MKSTERHRLKEDDIAQTLTRLSRAAMTQRRTEMMAGLIALAVVVLVVGGYFTWRSSREGRATTLLATALTVAEAPVVAPPPPAPGSAPPVQPPGTFRTERERADAALPRLQEAADAYPSSDAGITARFELANTLASLGRFAEAEQRYQEVVAKTSHSNIYHSTARLGLGEAQAAEGKGDAALATFKELATDSTSPLPLDGVLMQVGRAAAMAGKTDEATRAYTRVVDEFPQSSYVSEAREKLSGLKKA